MLGFSLPLYVLLGVELTLAGLLCLPLPISRPAVFIVKLSKDQVCLQLNEKPKHGSKGCIRLASQDPEGMLSFLSDVSEPAPSGCEVRCVET